MEFYALLPSVHLIVCSYNNQQTLCFSFIILNIVFIHSRIEILKIVTKIWGPCLYIYTIYIYMCVCLTLSPLFPMYVLRTTNYKAKISSVHLNVSVIHCRSNKHKSARFIDVVVLNIHLQKQTFISHQQILSRFHGKLKKKREKESR